MVFIKAKAQLLKPGHRFRLTESGKINVANYVLQFPSIPALIPEVVAMGLTPSVYVGYYRAGVLHTMGLSRPRTANLSPSDTVWIEQP